MANIRPVNVIAEKWAQVTPGRSEQYRAGIQDPRADWAQSTVAANAAWKSGVQAAISADRFSKGVARAGTPTWQRGALEKGVDRWGPGVALAQDKYQTAFAPFVEAIRRVQLPPRRARRDPANLLRVAAIVNALVAVKEALGNR